MFCEDSRATDIEHFWPKAVYTDRAFVWENLLWACTGCNRQKGDRFSIDIFGDPELIDPTSEDPWDVFYYDSVTYQLTPRWIVDPAQEHPRGVYTLRILSILANEAVTEGRRRTQRNLARGVRQFLKDVGEVGLSDSDASDSHFLHELFESICDNDGYGLTRWFFALEGMAESPFEQFCSQYPDTLASLRGMLRAHHFI
jgi:uncharacterized protein (TIGR02646 family)